MDKNLYVVEARWDEEAQVWVATSHDVPGLAVEAESTDELKQLLREVVPELLELNSVPAKAPVASVPRQPFYFRLSTYLEETVMA